ncbi:CxC2 domain-containing protein [Favolaschia claudopus]|uniref:CxC2 domain-containing protein n=1 Tax=Favolaschia claudopus TaxID=2862362 RepID=A0AAW0BV87_9AGAR
MHRRRTKAKPVLRGSERQPNQYVVNQSVDDFLTPTTDAPIRTVVQRPTADGRRVLSEVVSLDPPSPVKRARHQASVITEDLGSLAEDPLDFEPEGINGELYNMELGGFFPAFESSASSKKKRDPLRPSDSALHAFRALRDEYLQEFLRLDGCGDASTEFCPGCNAVDPAFRCLDCFGELLYCRACCVGMHKHNPLHRVERWDGRYFTRASLKSLGLSIQFGHEDCSRPRSAHENFVVVDLSGIHEVAVLFCGCERESEMGLQRVQLVRRRWFPATTDNPRTAFTFRVLDFFHTQTLQGKTTMFDFYTSLEKITDATGGSLPKRYLEFLRSTREYRHLLMLKRGGRGHALSGVYGTGPGDLAIRCPACPRAGVNLPEGWEDAPPETRFLYIIFLALDACFRLKRRLVSSELRDPGLGTGWAYFVEMEPYRQYLLTVTDQVEMSTCSGLAALDYANTKYSRGYSSTGPTGVGDLQKGERYANMDWIFASLLRWIHRRLKKVVSYDIVCQWYKQLKERLANLPPLVRLHVILVFFAFVIPKMHIHSHILACQLWFSLNLLPGAGQTDGEGIERPWANVGGVASSTREMGPGSRRNCLDDHWAFWNWCKLVGLAALLRRRLDNARRESAAQKEAFESFSLEQEERVQGWEEKVAAYEADPQNARNPYEITHPGMTEAQARLKIAEEEAEAVRNGVPALHDVSPSAFVFEGLELEDEQRRVRVQVELKKAGTTAQKIDVLALRRKLSRGITRFRKLQATYTPGALQALARREAPPDEVAENIPLMLPSALTAAERAVGCVASVEHVESLARDAQCSEALQRLRNQLHVKSRLFTYKSNHARHQGANTRSRTLVARNESKIRLHSEKYQAAWRALGLLSNGDLSKVGWPKLRREDVRMMEDPEELTKRQALRKKQDARRREKLDRIRTEEGVSIEEEDEEGVQGDGEEDEEMVVNTAENMRQVSWIWRMAKSFGTDAELEDALRIEWTKARARSKRWAEEVSLLEEEYRRMLVSFEYEAKQWEQRAKDIPVGEVDAAFGEGVIAYALKQAAMYRTLGERAVVTMEEVHHGRGRKRTQRPVPVTTEASGGGDGGGDEGGGSDGSDDESDGDGAGNVPSDEEYFMGGGEDDG